MATAQHKNDKSTKMSASKSNKPIAINRYIATTDGKKICDYSQKGSEGYTIPDVNLNVRESDDACLFCTPILRTLGSRQSSGQGDLGRVWSVHYNEFILHEEGT